MHTHDVGHYLIRKDEVVSYGDKRYKESLVPRTVIGTKWSLEYAILVVDRKSKIL